MGVGSLPSQFVMLRRAKTQGSRAGLREELPRSSVRWETQKVGHIEPFDGQRSAASSSSSYPGIQQAQRRRDSIWSNASHESQDTQGDDDIYARWASECGPPFHMPFWHDRMT